MKAAATLPTRRSRIADRALVRDFPDPVHWTCGVSNNRLIAGLDAKTARRVEQLANLRIRIRRGATLYRSGAPFSALYAVDSGSLKSVFPGEDGRDQVAGYHMAGEVIGLDGVGNDVYECQAIALEDSAVYAMPFDRMEALARDCPAFQHNVHRYLSREIARQRWLTFILGTMRAEQRLALFLLDLSRRYEERGYSSSEFVLRMTRAEIASYLGLKLETVSRALARLHAEGLIHVEGRIVKLLDGAALKQLAHTD